MSIWPDVRHGARLLVKERSLSAAAVGALALAMAAVTTIATLANGVFFRPLPFEDPERIVLPSTQVTVNANTSIRGVSYAELQDWRAGTRTFSAIAGFTEQPVNLADDTVAPERLNAIYQTANMFRMIGRSPALGRDFVEDDDRPGAAPVVILGARVWRTRYGADASVIGRAVRINGETATVVGVMPDGFAFPDIAEIWQPLGARPESRQGARTFRAVNMIGRLASGVTREQAAADLSALLRDLAARYPEAGRGVTPLIREFRDRSVGRVRVVFTAFAAAAAFVLLLACANVANLLLARGIDRAREITIRLSMGASRGRITLQLLTESLVLGSVAGALGLGLSVAGVAAFQRAMDADGGAPYWIAFPIDWRVLTSVVAVSLVSSALFGLVPALQTTRVSLTSVLADSGRTSTGSRRQRFWQNSLVTAQVALAIVLLTTAGLTLRDLQAATRADVGIDASAVMTARFLLPETRYPTAEARTAFYRRLDTRVARLSAGAGVLAMYPPSQGAERRYAAVDAEPVPASGRTVSFISVGPRYFATLSDRPVRGREFAETDGPGIAVVNERFAELHFGDVDPIGRTVTVAGFSPRNEPVRMTIVGVAPNVRHRSTDDRQFDPTVYVSHTAEAPVYATLILRSTAGIAATASAMREAMRAIDPDLPLFQMASVAALLEEDRWEGRMLSTVFGLIAALALTLAAVGVYGVTAFAVAKRAREICLRVALGAPAAHICALVARGLASPIAVGVVLGLGGAVALWRALQTLLREIEPNDPVTLVAVPLVLAAVATLAGYVPARRALRGNLADALRAE